MTKQHTNFTRYELSKNENFKNSDVFPHHDYVYYIRGQFYALACSRQWRRYDDSYYNLVYPFQFNNNTDLTEVMRAYMKNQQHWFKTRNVSWNGVVDPPFAEVLTSTTYGRTFNLLEMADLYNDENL